MSHLTKIHPAAAELFHSDGQTDITKPKVAFRSFANAPNNSVRTAQKTLAVCSTKAN
jgi:hypothetical protein